jgi:hypothetical protein
MRPVISAPASLSLGCLNSERAGARWWREGHGAKGLQLLGLAD